MSVFEAESVTEAPDGDDAPPSNGPFTSRPDFPHEAVHALWKARIECGADATKQNRKVYKEARDWYRGGKAEWRFEGADAVCSPQLRVSANVWYRMVTILLSHLAVNDPRVLVEASKGVEFDAFAKAAQKLAQATFREMRYRVEIQKALVEAILRNRSYLYQGWDSQRWMPTLQWCSDEVFLDPDAGGDTRNAGWIAEQYTAKLDDLLADPEITDEIKELLRTTTGAHVNTRDRTPNDDGATELSDGSRSWDSQGGFKKVVAYRIYSREGLLPGSARTDGDTVDESNIPEWMRGTSPFRGGSDRPTDASPKATEGDPIDAAGRRVQLLLVKGIDKVVKAVPWSMTHYDRDEFPYIRLQFSFVPDDPDGVTLFQIMRPLFIAKNGIISFALADAKLSSQRRIGIDETVVTEESERTKITNGKHLEAYLKRGPGGVTVDEFGAKNPTSLLLLPEIDSIIEDTSGVNDAIKGQSGSVEKTKAEAVMLHDSASAALAYLDNPFEVCNEDVCRYTIMAGQKYVRARTLYEPCESCGQPCPDCMGAGCEACVGRGRVKGTGQAPPPPMPMPAMQPMLAGGPPPAPTAMACPTCRGSGNSPTNRDPLRKGADFWLSQKDAAAWRDDLTLEQIRAEVVVSIESGSTRRDYRERRVGLLNQLYDRLGPEYRELGLMRPLGHLRREMIMATELPNAEAALPDEKETATVQQKSDAMQAAQLAQAQMAAQPPPGPDPAAMQAEQQAAQQAQAQEGAKFQLEQGKAAAEQQEKQARLQLDAQAQQAKIDLDSKRLELDAAEKVGRAEVERKRVGHDERRVGFEESASGQAAQGNADVTGKVLEILNGIAQGAAQAAQVQAQATAMTTQAIAALAGLVQSLGASARNAAGVVSSGQSGHARTQAEIRRLEQIMAAPVVADKVGGKWTAQRDLSGVEELPPAEDFTPEEVPEYAPPPPPVPENAVAPEAMADLERRLNALEDKPKEAPPSPTGLQNLTVVVNPPAATPIQNITNVAPTPIHVEAKAGEQTIHSHVTADVKLPPPRARTAKITNEDGSVSDVKLDGGS